MTLRTMAVDEAEQAVALYVVLDRDPLDFLEMVAAAPAPVVSILHEMLTTPYPTSDMELNKIGAGLIDGIYRRNLAARNGVGAEKVAP